MAYQYFYGSDFLIFDAITRKPMTTRELSHLLQLSDRAVVKRLKRFADMTPPLVVRRWPDRRWVPTVVMRVETPKETVEAETGEPVVMPKATPSEPTVQDGKVVYPAAPAAPAEPATLERPNPVLPPPAPKPYVPPTPQTAVSDRAKRIAQKMNVPAHLVEYGEVSLGRMGACAKCGAGTPMAFGSTNVCPKCSRGGR